MQSNLSPAAVYEPVDRVKSGTFQLDVFLIRPSHGQRSRIEDIYYALLIVFVAHNFLNSLLDFRRLAPDPDLPISH